MEQIAGMDLLSQLETGSAIDVRTGTWGNGGGAVQWWPLVDSHLLATAESEFSLFDIAANSQGKTKYQTNMPAAQVPDGNRWDFYGMYVFMLPLATGASIPEADYASFRAMLLGSTYTFSINQQIIRTVPFWFHFGGQGMQNTAVTPTLALQTPMPATSWYEPWPRTCYLGLQSNTKITFLVQLKTAVPSNLAGYSIGVGFDRAVAGLVP